MTLPSKMKGDSVRTSFDNGLGGTQSHESAGADGRISSRRQPVRVSALWDTP